MVVRPKGCQKGCQIREPGGLNCPAPRQATPDIVGFVTMFFQAS